MEDIRQPLDNPYLETDCKTLAKEVAKYRAIAADRAQREEEALAEKVLAALDRGSGKS
jgi:GAF domain-containing protein